MIFFLSLIYLLPFVFGQIEEETTPAPNITEILTVKFKAKTLEQSMGKVYDQGEFNSCNVIAINSIVENAWLERKKTSTIELSHQELWDCITTVKDETKEEKGLSIDQIVGYITRNFGLSTKDAYETTPGSGCKRDLLIDRDTSNRMTNPNAAPAHIKFKITKEIVPIMDSTKPEISLVDNFLKSNVPLLVPVYAGDEDDNWKAFGSKEENKEKLFANEKCPGTPKLGGSRPRPDHALVLFKLGEENGEKYMEFRNTYGENFHHNGNLRVKYGKNICGFGVDAVKFKISFYQPKNVLSEPQVNLFLISCTICKHIVRLVLPNLETYKNLASEKMNDLCQNVGAIFADACKRLSARIFELIKTADLPNLICASAQLCDLDLPVLRHEVVENGNLTCISKIPIRSCSTSLKTYVEKNFTVPMTCLRTSFTSSFPKDWQKSPLLLPNNLSTDYNQTVKGCNL